MRFFSFHLMPYPALPAEYDRPAWIDVPNRLFDPEVGHDAYNRYIDELIAAEALGFDGVCVNEHHQMSLGGWLAAEVAVQHPECVGGLVFVNPAGLYLPEAPVPDIFRGRGDALPIPFDMVRPVLQGMAANAKLAWDPYLHDPKLPRRVYRATMLALVVRGALDRLLAPAHARRYVELLPDARLVEIPGAGHRVAPEKPAELAAAIREFLA